MEKTILIVDDLENTRNIVSFALKDDGYNILQAEDGLDALKYLEKAPIDLIITDLEMPNMNGIELTKHIRGRSSCRATPVLMLSQEGRDSTRDEARAAGITVWMDKPLTLEKFKSTIRKLMR